MAVPPHLDCLLSRVMQRRPDEPFISDSCPAIFCIPLAPAGSTHKGIYATDQYKDPENHRRRPGSDASDPNQMLSPRQITQLLNILK